MFSPFQVSRKPMRMKRDENQTTMEGLGHLPGHRVARGAVTASQRRKATPKTVPHAQSRCPSA